MYPCRIIRPTPYTSHLSRNELGSAATQGRYKFKASPGYLLHDINETTAYVKGCSDLTTPHLEGPSRDHWGAGRELSEALLLPATGLVSLYLQGRGSRRVFLK